MAANMIKKKFINEELGIEITSFIDKQQNIFLLEKMLQRYLVIKIVIKLLENMLMRKIEKAAPSKRRVRLDGLFFINESGFYSLILSSKLETAKKFKRWITSEVLPSIRKFGYYKLFDPRIKQRVIIDGKKYYKHPVFSNYAANKNGEVINVKTGRNMKMNKVGSGYLQFTICNKKLEKRKNYYQHRFVFEVFKGAIPHFFEIDHRDNDKKNNRIKNLQLLNHRKNIQKSHNKPIISISIETGEEKKYVSLTKASIELGIKVTRISSICCQRKYNKTATSKSDGCKYTFKFID